MCDIDRNLPETALQKIRANGGLVTIGFWGRVLCGDSVADVAASMRYVADKIGTEHVALGSDFDGGVKTVFDATGLPLLTDALFDAGFSDLEIRQIMAKTTRNCCWQVCPHDNNYAWPLHANSIVTARTLNALTGIGARL